MRIKSVEDLKCATLILYSYRGIALAARTKSTSGPTVIITTDEIRDQVLSNYGVDLDVASIDRLVTFHADVVGIEKIGRHKYEVLLEAAEIMLDEANLFFEIERIRSTAKYN